MHVKEGTGGGGEDYRRVVIRKRVGPIWFQVMNIILIVPGQMLVVWLFSSPIHQVWQAVGTPLGVLDIMLTVLFLILLTGETVADEQMWRFQKEKKRRLATGERKSFRHSSPAVYSDTLAIPVVSATLGCGTLFICLVSLLLNTLSTAHTKSLLLSLFRFSTLRSLKRLDKSVV